MSDQSNERCDWNNPAAIWREVAFVKLEDDGALSVTVEGGEYAVDPSYNPQYTFKWTRYYAYRTAVEENGVPWDVVRNPHVGSFHLVDNSSWIEALSKGNAYLDMLHPNAQHFVICTQDVVIEVVSNENPQVEISNLEKNAPI